MFLAGHDLSPYVSGVTWLDEAITVNRATWPVLTMEWIDGRTLNEYVDFLVSGSNTAALATLAANCRELVALLPRARVGPRLSQTNSAACSRGTVNDRDGNWTAL